jgi:hypothetical protein
MLFEPEFRFAGLPAAGFEAFGIADRRRRREAIIEAFHPRLHLLGEDLLARLRPESRRPLHVHLPRLDWPHDYEPFCTWIALSTLSHGYQTEPQLNIGVHRDHVAVRLGWDTRAAAFGRFEFVCRYGGVGEELVVAGGDLGLAFRVYAAADWPEGSARVFESPAEYVRGFQEAHRRGVWFEFGARYDLPGALEIVTTRRLGEEASRIFKALLPFYERLAGDGGR